MFVWILFSYSLFFIIIFSCFLVTHNPRFRQFVFLDSRGITSWSYESVYSTGTTWILFHRQCYT